MSCGRRWTRVRTICLVSDVNDRNDRPAHSAPVDHPRWADEEVVVREALGRLYGAATALVADDRDGAMLLLDDLRDGFGSLTELLVTVSLATLERLEDAFRHQSLRPPDASRPSARTMLATAEGYRVAPPRSVHAAAWRLDAVRCNDRSRAAADAAESAAAGGDRQLVAGAVALLAAALTHGAIANGEDPLDAARRLCLAASFS